jgi:hypothetical protein
VVENGMSTGRAWSHSAVRAIQRDDGERHLEVRVGNVETVDGCRQVFGAITSAETDITALMIK